MYYCNICCINICVPYFHKPRVGSLKCLTNRSSLLRSLRSLHGNAQQASLFGAPQFKRYKSKKEYQMKSANLLSLLLLATSITPVIADTVDTSSSAYKIGHNAGIIFVIVLAFLVVKKILGK
jgi:hypothetical protein